MGIIRRKRFSICVFRQENIHKRTAELGYYIAQEYWGKGIMTEAVKQICEYVFGSSDIIRIYAEPFAHNSASCRVLEKAGFQYVQSCLPLSLLFSG